MKCKGSCQLNKKQLWKEHNPSIPAEYRNREAAVGKS